MEDLKPCPFCGHTDSLQVSWVHSESFKQVICSALSDGCGASSGGYESEDEAVKIWNTRAQNKE